MKRLISITLSTMLAVACLSACRAPVSVSGHKPLRINIEVPADLSSDVPAAVRKAIADALLGSDEAASSRFIHPDASYAVATITGPGVDLLTEAVTVSAGSSAELSFPSVPVRPGLTLTVRVFDADGAIVGERVVSDLALDGDQSNVTVGIAPYGAVDLSVGANGEPEFKTVDETGATCYVFKADISSPGLFSIRGLMNGGLPRPTEASMSLYDTDGQLVTGYYDDSEDPISYGLFVNESDETASYYLVYTIGPDWSNGLVGIEATQYTAAIAVYGKTSPDDTSARLLVPGIDTIVFNDVSSIGSVTTSMDFVLRNYTDNDLSLSSVEATTGDWADSGTFSLTIVAPTVLLARREETIRVQLTDGEINGDIVGTLSIDSDDPMLPFFELSLSGTSAC